MIAPRPPVPSDDVVLGRVPSHPEIVIRIAEGLGADVFDVEASLKRLAERGAVERHPAGLGVPVKWSLAL